MSTRRMDGAARRTHLLDAARRRFADDGYHATTMSSIAREAGVSEPLLFKHFASKEELFRHSIVEPMLRLLRDYMVEHPPDEPIADQEAGLRSFFLAWASFVREQRTVALTLLAEVNRFPDVGAEVWSMLQQHVADLATRNAATTDRPEYRRFDHTVATWSGLATATVAGLVADDLDSFVDAYVDLVLHGIRA